MYNLNNHDIRRPLNAVYLIAIHNLREVTYKTTGKGGKTLEDIFESASIPKAFFDIRNDSKALYAQCSVALQGIQDV